MVSVCALNEPYSVLIDIERTIIAGQVSPSLWISNSGLQSTIDTLYALSFLSSFREKHGSSHWSQLVELSEIVAKYALKDRESYIAYCLSMALLLKRKALNHSEVRNKLLETSRKLLSKKGDVNLQVDVIYGLALFWLVSRENTKRLSIIEEEAHLRAETLCDLYGLINSTESKVKLLFTLSVFPKCANLLFELHSHRRMDVENIRQSPISEITKILLLKPFTDLEINCHKSLISEALIPLRTENRSITERGILQRISSLLLFGEDTSSGTRLETKDNASRLIIDISENELANLQEPEVSIRYPSIVGLSLIAAGYSDVYIVPESERDDYTQFRMKIAEESGNAIRTEIRGLRRLVDEYTGLLIRFESYKSTLLFLMWIVFAYLGGSALFSGIQGTIEPLPSAAGIVSGILFLFLSIIEKVPKDFYIALTKRKEHKTEIKDNVMGMLGIEEGALGD